MVIFGIKCVLEKGGGYDLYGGKKAGTSTPDRCAIVKLAIGQQHSTVRVDSGATRGGADELRADAVLLMPKVSKVAIDDLITIPSHNIKVRVTGIRPRHSVAGRLDHYQVEAKIEV